MPGTLLLLFFNTKLDLTAPKVAEEEILEPSELVEQKATTLANQIKKSKHFIAFTGAGISTSAGEALSVYRK